MEIGYSDSTLLLNIIRLAQGIADEARWMEYYAHTPAERECISDCAHNIAENLTLIKESLDYLNSKEM